MPPRRLSHFLPSDQGTKQLHIVFPHRQSCRQKTVRLAITILLQRLKRNHVVIPFGEGIAILADILDPEMIVIGGVFMRCEDLISESMWRVIRREALPHIAKRMKVVPAKTGEAIGDFAAVMVALYGKGIMC